MKDCNPPNCQYSIQREDCIRPNPYIERLSYCSRNNISKKDCIYDARKAYEKACDYYYERIQKKDKKINYSNIILEKQKELEKIKDEIKLIEEKINIPHEKNSLLESINKFEKDLDYELMKFNKSDKKSDKKSSLKEEIKITDKKSDEKLLSILKKQKSINISDRIKYYHIIHNYIKGIKQNKNCFNAYKNTEDEIKYRIGENIILDKKIGDDSKYGIVFISHYIFPKNKEIEKNLIFATKLSDYKRSANITEYIVLKFLTKLNIDNICPHFPIGYGKLICRKIDNDNQDFKLLTYKQGKLGSKLYNIDHIYIFNELANGSLYQLYKSLKKTLDFNILLNAFEQCIMAIIFFNKYTNAYHNDCHAGNFLYHKITPGGYIHYKIYGNDYYIKNIGYLWVIWDYGLISPYYNSYNINRNKFGNLLNILPINNDFKRFTSIFNKIIPNNYTINSIKDFLKFYDIITDVTNIKQFTIDLLENLARSSTTFKKSINSTNSKIVNSTPYIIN